MQIHRLVLSLTLTTMTALGGLIWGLAGAPVSAQNAYQPARTEWGVPDLQGTWSIATQTTLERPERFNDKPVLTEEEALQFESAVRARNEAASAPSDPGRAPPREGVNVGGYNNFWMDPGERCLVGFGSTAGPPKLPVSYNKDYVVLLAEMNHDARIVRLGKSFREPTTYDWISDSIGYYQGDTQ